MQNGNQIPDLHKSQLDNFILKAQNTGGYG